MQRVSFSKNINFNFARIRISPPSEEARIGWFFSVDLDGSLQSWIRIPDTAFQVNPDLGFWWPKIEEKIHLKIFFIFNDQKLQFTYVQAFSPQKRTYSTSKNAIFFIFSMFVGHFCPPGSGYGSRDPIESGSTTLELKYIFLHSGEEYFCPVRGEARG